MNLETFFEKFELFADAPDAVAKMRELVLELAVQGKLVDQNLSDESGAELLQRLVEFKSANPLVGRSGRSKESSPEADSEDTEPNDLPANWAKTTIGEVLYVIRGASPRPKGDPQYFSESRTPFHWVKISDIRKHGQNGLLMDTDEFLTEAGMRKSVLLPKGTLVLTNSATIGVPIVLGIEGCCIHDGYLAFPNFPHDLLSQKFLLYLFHTLKKHSEQNARGLAQLNLNTELVRSFPFGLPPLAEQKRIVAKVDELMALCDLLEAQQQEREARHSALAHASLARFAEAPTPANLNLLFHLSYTISPADLRKSILTLAVQGKLVPQDPNDEPAEVFLGLIADHLGKPKGKRSMNNGAATADEAKPFDLPPGWAWSRFPELGEFGRGKSKHRPRNDPSLFVGGTHRLVQTGDVARSNGTIRSHTGLYNDVGLAQSKKWPAGTLCITIAANIADSGILAFDACFPNSVVGFIPAAPIPSVHYFEFFMRTAKEHLEQFAPSTAQKNINLGILEQVWIPIPPSPNNAGSWPKWSN